jgi:formylglycine-generating enzyme required for sulfatase activity
MFDFLFRSKKKQARHEVLVREILDDMVLIPAGSFLMGSNDGEDDERPIHNVLLNSFELGKYEVTQGQWVGLMETRPWQGSEYVEEGDNFPVVNVSWYQVKEFIRKLNRASGKRFRMPTEAEWEYACRAGSRTRFFYGSFKLKLSQYAWYYDNAFKKQEMHPHQVGKLKPNKWDLYDMMGNVYEWCSDWYKRNYYNKSPVQNPKGPKHSAYKVVRGGDWARTDYFLRVSSRRYYHPHFKDINVGFRLAKDIDNG